MLKKWLKWFLSLFRKKEKQRTIIFEGKKIPVYEMPEYKEINWAELPEVTRPKILVNEKATEEISTELSKPLPVTKTEKETEEIILPKYRNKLQFRKQQLIGKVLTLGKNRIRIHKDAETVYNKFNYYIEKI